MNQVAWALPVSGIMEPFRELIKPNNKFLWTAELDKLFGWQLTCIGSRFRTPTEKQYSPTDGEAAASCLNSAKMSVVGCQYLIVITDRKLLLSIFNNRDLCTIMSPQISKSKEKKHSESEFLQNLYMKQKKLRGPLTQFLVFCLQLLIMLLLKHLPVTNLLPWNPKIILFIILLFLVFTLF